MKNRKLPLAVCHRTNAGGCPENSLSGILAAMALGVDMIELDLQRTADGRLVLMHDSSIARTTSGKGEVRSYTYEELSRFRLKTESRFHEGIPLFEEVLELVHNSEVKLVLEMKSPDKFPGIGADVVQLLEQYKMRARVAVISFDHGFLRQFKQDYPDIFVGSLTVLPLGLKASSNFDAVGIFYPGLLLLNKPYLKSLRKLLRLENSAIYVYTANSKKVMRQLLKMGVEGIITDRPEVLLHVMRPHRS